MAKRARPKPLDEGPLKDIYNWFFKPIVERFGDPESSAHSFMEKLFDVDHRKIEQYQAVKQFRMPGLYYAAARVKLQGVGVRRVTRGTFIMARIDDKSPGIDVEFFGGRGGRELVFHLTPAEWEEVKLNLKSEGLRAHKPRHRGKVRRKKHVDLSGHRN